METGVVKGTRVIGMAPMTDDPTLCLDKVRRWYIVTFRVTDAESY